MADYSAKIKLELENEGVLRRLQARLEEINKTISQIEKLNLARVMPPQGGKFQKNPSKQVLADAKELAEQLRQGITISKQYAEADKRRYAEGLTGQLKLNNAIELYERRLKNLNRAGAFDVKERAKNIRAIQEQYEVGIKQRDVKLIQQAAVGLGRLLETQRELNRTAKSKAALQRSVFDYNKQIEQLRLIGVTEGKLRKALESRDELNARISRNEIDRARISEDALKRQITLLQQQTKLTKGVGLTSPISGRTPGVSVIAGSPADIARTAKAATSWKKFFADAENVAATLNARALNTRTSWQKFFADASAAAKDLQGTKAATSANLKTNWNRFFQEAAEVAQELQTTAASKALNIRSSWNTFFQEAQDLAVELAVQTQQTAAQIRRIEGSASASARQRLADESARRARIQNAGFGVQGPALPPSAARSGGPGRFSNVVLGAGFPLLFGGGPGAVLGGAAGGLVGGPGAFAAQIGLSALGQQLDQFAASAARTGAALNPATADLDTLSQALGLTGTATAEYIKKLEDLEQQDEALAVATEEMARLVGYDGVRALKDFGSAATDLSNEWSKAMTQMQAALAGLLAGPLQAFANQLESANLYRQAQASSDPRIQELLQQRNRPGIFGGSGNKSINEITNEIINLQRQANAEAQKRKQIEENTVSTFDQQRRVLEAQLDLAYTDGDLTQDKVYKLQQVVINKEFEVKLQQAINDGTNSELIQLERKVKLQQLAVQREQALQAAAEKAAKELERQRKEMERMAKLRREQLSEAQRGFVLAELDLGVAATGTDEKARTQAEFDRRRAERMFEYTEALQKALSEEERSFLVAKQELDIFTAKLLLNKELFDIDLQRSKLLNQQDSAATIQEEINLLAAKIQGKEEEYKITKMIADLELAGVTDAADRVGALQGLRAQNEAIEAQKQLWADIYTTVAGQLQQAISGLIDGTAEWGDLLSNILGSLGNLFVSAGFNALGGALKLPGFRANGGPVSSNTPYIVGERGPELFVPSSSGSVMSNADTRAALAEQSAARSTNDTRAMLEQQTAARQANATGMALQQKPIDVRYESSVINNVEYVTADQHRKGLAQAAERGRALTLAALQNSTRTRKKVGI